MYTLELVNRIADQLRQSTDEVVAEFRRRAAEGDPESAAVVAEWDRLGDPDPPSES